MSEFPKKWEKVLKQTDFMDTAESKSGDELKEQILKSQNIISDEERAMENDVKLSALKEDLKALSGAYKDAMKLEKAKTAYCLHLLRERGQGDS